ncbi:MAG: hypothetical protein QOG49_449 [Frankiaceae bacterium]|nr:hypothetical protein [Frankiaceae bacterium]
MLTTAGRRVRMAATLGIVALTLLGTRYSQDEAFPFGPMSMFAFRTMPDGHVDVASLRGVVSGTTDEVAVSTASFGLRRAEVEGSMGRMQTDPTLLADLVRARETGRRDLPKLDYLRIVQTKYLLRDGQKIGLTESTVAEWHR